MNDFTKKELEMILSDLEHAVFSRYYRDGMDKIRIKIKSMIDNYCEHEPSDAHYEQYRWQLCQKCGVQYK